MERVGVVLDVMQHLVAGHQHGRELLPLGVVAGREIDDNFHGMTDMMLRVCMEGVAAWGSSTCPLGREEGWW